MAYRTNKQAAESFSEDVCATCHGDGQGKAAHHSREGASNPRMETNQDFQGRNNPEGSAPRRGSAPGISQAEHYDQSDGPDGNGPPFQGSNKL